MSGWNYRVVYHPSSKYKVGDTEFNRDEYVAIHEVYYGKDDKPYAMTIDGIVIGDEGCETLKSLKWILEHQLEALSKPILEYEMKDGIYKDISLEKQNELSKIVKDKEKIGSEDCNSSEGYTGS